jgi:hypothetical protein
VIVGVNGYAPGILAGQSELLKQCEETGAKLTA